MRPGEHTPALLLSPHFDDAVFSAWTLLAGARPLTVVNLFAGAPGDGVLARWDRIAGATDSASWVARRREEDRAALRALGHEPVSLELLDAQYRAPDVFAALGGAPEPAEPRAELLELRAALERQVPAASAVYAPAAIGGHVDHQLAAALGLSLAADGLPLTLYADLPYAVALGWPARIAGGPVSRADASWEHDLGRLPATLAEPTVVELTEEEGRRKLDSMRAYRTQFEALDALTRNLLSDPACVRYEVFWSVTR